MKEAKYICWDLDQTLGNFLPSQAAYNHRSAAAAGHERGLRPGMREFLETSVKNNVYHFITIGGENKEHAREVLEINSISSYFTAIFAGKDIDAGFGKRYKPVLDYLGIPAEQAKSDLVVTGDLTSDQPVDLDNVVFIWHPGAFRYPASHFVNVFNMLVSAGEGNIHLGFLNTMLANTHQKIDWNASAVFEYRNLIKENPNWRYRRNLKIPTVRIINTPI